MPVLQASAVDCTTASQCATAGIQSASGGAASTSTSAGTIIKSIVNILMFVIGAVAVVMIVIGGLRYTLAQGDSASLQAAKSTILYSVIGLVVSILAYSIVGFAISSITGGATIAANSSSNAQATSAQSSNTDTSATDSSTTTSTPPDPTPDPTPTPAPVVTPTPAPAPAPAPAPTYQYRNGTYTSSVGYTPKGLADTITVTLAIESDKVTGVSVNDNPSNGTSKYYVNQFIAALPSAVNGKSLSSLSPSRVGGATLTTNAFNQAVSSIRSKAS